MTGRLHRLTGRALAALLASLLALAPAAAHKPSDSYLSLETDGRQVRGQWDIALRDLDHVLALDADGDGMLTWDEVRRRETEIAGYALARLDLATPGGACRPRARALLVDRHTDGAYAVLRFEASCRGGAETLTIGYRLFADVDPQHRGLLRLVHSGTVASAVLVPGPAAQTFAPGTPARGAQLAGYVREGVRHIWIGADHVLFLLSLLLPAVLLAPGAPARQALASAGLDVLKVVTAFTLAHSLTLSLATLHVVSLPTRWVESAIAASVALAALNNLQPLPLLRGRRAVVAFGFGLVHGFGFAGVLAELGLHQDTLLLSLLGFNLGVEVGQMAIVAAFLPLAFLLRTTLLYRWAVNGGSALIAGIAVLWLAERAFDLKILPV